jgi:hypothetical protein
MQLGSAFADAARLVEAETTRIIQTWPVQPSSIEEQIGEIEEVARKLIFGAAPRFGQDDASNDR